MLGNGFNFKHQISRFFLKNYMKNYSESNFILNSVNSKKIVIHESKNKLNKPDYSKPIPWGQLHTDYMLELDWDENDGWDAPVISAFHNLEIDPRNSTIHYAIQLFEGMKAYRSNDKIVLFRPEMNMKRLLTSAERIGLPVNNSLIY